MAKKPAENAGFTDTKRVKDLIALMAENGLTELELVDDKRRIVLRRGTSTAAAPVAGHAVAYAPAPAPVASAPVAAPAPAAPVAPEAKTITIKSPMVGTYYAAPSPDASPYVSVGSAVDGKTVVCIIEAMKVFNPIPAEVSGTIVKILATNGQVVEYGQPLFEVKP
jgi:acetyl-CoA carboxylase biotin carboxyl carrier protein